MQPPPRKLDPLAAFLTYLVPGLGQVMQGRIGKGVLYFVCLYGLFFYGLSLGQWRNVWLADAKHLPDVQAPIVGSLTGLPKDLFYRKEFLAQFWMGAAAWPAVLQYASTEPLPDPRRDDEYQPKPHRVFGKYMQAPSEGELNQLQRDGNKNWDLGWVFTVIAGALNVLVIYDAFAGPLVRDDQNPDGSPITPPTGGAK
jgi:TM2 domain-containing membrane protein YozV